MNKTNPAKRLLKILEKASKLKGSLKNRIVWSTVFNLQENDDIGITKNLIYLEEQVSEMERLINLEDEIDHKLFLSPCEDLRSVLIPINLHVNWERQKTILKTHTLDRLKYCDDKLLNIDSEEELTTEELEEINKATNDLFNQVRDSNIDGTLKQTLLEELENIRQAIASYYINGIKAFNKSVRSTIGTIVVNQDTETNILNSTLKSNLKSYAFGMFSIGAKALKNPKVILSAINYLWGDSTGNLIENNDLDIGLGNDVKSIETDGIQEDEETT